MYRALIYLLGIWLAIVPAFAGQMSLLGAGAASSTPPSYQGPGDVAPGATVFVSCARVYTAALASTSTSLCDLVAITGGASVCTLRGSASGFVDLAASYCAGTTPSAACAAASGGSCKVTKMYDQTGTGNHFTNATLSSMPTLTFSGLNSLPGLGTTSGSASVLTSVNTFTQVQPFSFGAVGQRTGNIVNPNVLIASGATDTMIGWAGSGNTRAFCVSTGQNGTATESVYHSVLGVCSTTVGAINTDGTDVTGSTGTGVLSAATIRLMRSASGASTTGNLMEAFYYPSALSAGDRSNLNTNMHSLLSGYNF